MDQANELLTNGSTTYTSDANGNRLTETGPALTRSYVWDSRNRLSSTTDNSGNMTAFKYDFARNLIEMDKTVGGSATSQRFVVDSLTNVASLTDSSGLPVSVLTGRSIDSHLASIDSSGNVTFSIGDALNSTVGLTGSTGMIVSSLDYEPYGQATGAVETAYPFSFTGRVPVTAGVSYFRGRFYDSSSDRFLSEDWSRLAIDLNLYRYVRGSPVNFRDPSGRNVVAVALLIIYLLEEYARDRALEQEAEQTGDTNGYQTGGATIQNETMGPPNEQNQPPAGSDSGQPAGNEQQPDCEFGNPRIWERLQWLSRFFRM